MEVEEEWIYKSHMLGKVSVLKINSLREAYTSHKA